MNKQTRFILAIVFQILIIFGIIVYKIAILTDGSEILLKIKPVDPIDYLRGDYINFQYSISTIKSYPFLSADTQVRNGDTVYVLLYKKHTYWDVLKIQKTKPINSDYPFIKGKVVSGGADTYKTSTRNSYKNPPLHIVYGIEQYFIPEGKAKTINFQDKEIFAKVLVDKNGNAVIKQIYINNTPWP